MLMNVQTLNSRYSFRGEVVLRNGEYLGVLVRGTTVRLSRPYGEDGLLCTFTLDTTLPVGSFVTGDGRVRTSWVQSVEYGTE
jgi:hypothetical protein